MSSGGGRLVVCPTPIGNLEDVTLRVLAALRDADLIACEDTRRTRVLLERYGVQASLLSYHEHNERERTPELVAQMLDGATVALVSDAGMPLVSDPGYVLGGGLHRRGARGRGAARPVGRDRRARGERPARGALALRRLPAAQARARSRRCSPRRRPWWRSSRRAAWARLWRSSPRSTRTARSRSAAS